MQQPHKIHPVPARFLQLAGRIDATENGQLKPGYNVQIAVNSEYITGVAAFSNRLYLEVNSQTSFIKPINYEVQKTKKFKAQIGRRENMQYDELEDCYICVKAESCISGVKTHKLTNMVVFRPWRFIVAKTVPIASTDKLVPKQKMMPKKRLKFLQSYCG